MGAYVDLAGDGGGDEGGAALPGQGDRLAGVRDRGVDLGGLVVEVVGDLLLSLKRWYRNSELTELFLIDVRLPATIGEN